MKCVWVWVHWHFGGAGSGWGACRAARRGADAATRIQGSRRVQLRGTDAMQLYSRKEPDIGTGKRNSETAGVKAKHAGARGTAVGCIHGAVTLVLAPLLHPYPHSPRPSRLRTRARRRGISGCCTCWRGGRSSRRRWSARARAARGQRCEGAADGGVCNYPKPSGAVLNGHCYRVSVRAPPRLTRAACCSHTPPAPAPACWSPRVAPAPPLYQSPARLVFLPGLAFTRTLPTLAGQPTFSSHAGTSLPMFPDALHGFLAPYA